MMRVTLILLCCSLTPSWAQSGGNERETCKPQPICRLYPSEQLPPRNPIGIATRGGLGDRVDEQTDTATNSPNSVPGLTYPLPKR
jgi:hypothetical protein